MSHVQRFRALVAVVATTLATLLVVPDAPAQAVVTPSCAAAGISVTPLGGPNFYVDGQAAQFSSGYTGYRVTNGTGAAVDDVWVSLSGFTGGKLALASGQSAAQRLGPLASGAADSLFWYLTASGSSASAQTHTITVYRHDPALATGSALCTTTNGFSAVEGTIAANANKVDGITVSGGSPTLGSTFTVRVTGDTGTIGAGTSIDPESLWMTPAVSETWPADSFRLVGTALTMSPDGTAPQQTFTDTLRLAHLGSKARAYTAAYTFQAVGFTSRPTTVLPVQEIASGTQVKHTGAYPATLPAIPQPVNDLVATLSGSTTRLDSGGGTVSFTASVSGTVGASIDSFVLTPPAGTQPVAGSVRWAGQVAQDPVWQNNTLVFPGPFTLAATSARLTFDVAVDGDPGPQAFSLLGTIGPSFIGTAASPVDGSNPATFSVSVNSDPTAGDLTAYVDPDVTSTVSVAGRLADPDNDPLTVTAVQPAAHGTVALVGGQITYTPEAGFTGHDTFTYTVADGHGGSASGTVTVQVTATPPPPQAQSIAFDQPATLTAGETQALQVTASSGLTATLTSQTPGTCTVTGTMLTAVSAGTCTLVATQPGDTVFDAATPVTRDVTVEAVVIPPVSLLAQAIAFDQPATLTAGETQALQVTASSGLPVALTSQSPGTCTVTGTMLTAVSAGTCTLVATQPGDTVFDAATPVTRDVTVEAVVTPPVQPPATPLPQTITFRAPASLLSGPAPVRLEATSSSGLPVELSVLSGGCTLDGSLLVAIHDTVCTVRAAQGGNADFTAAQPTQREIAFVSPLDDDAAMPGPLDGPDSIDVAVLENDPAGLELSSVDAPAHGSAVVVGDAVRYTPTPTFHGIDEAAYTVTDAQGRTATATVRVAVANVAPVVRGARVRQLAGTTTSVPLAAADPNDDPMSVTALSADAGIDVSVRATQVAIAAGRAVSGWVTVTATVTDTLGAATSARIRDLVRPVPVESASRTLSDAGTLVRWSRADTRDARYQVLVDGRVLCTTDTLSCATGRVLGPAFDVRVRVLGRDGTLSERTAARPEGHHQVLIATVYFDSGDARLSSAQTRELASVARRILSMGFGVAQVSGYTDSDGGAAYNLALSRRRTRTVGDYLRGHGAIRSRSAWFGYDDPVAPNSSEAGKALNRRVEILVRY